jgi:hypothetical protein
VFNASPAFRLPEQGLWSTGPLMNETRFWKIIESSRRSARQMKRRPGQDFLDVHMHTLAEALGQLPPAGIIAFRERFWYYSDAPTLPSHRRQVPRHGGLTGRFSYKTARC